MKSNVLKVATVVLLSVFLLSFLLMPAVRPVEAGPLAAVTPVSFSGGGGDNGKFVFFNGNVTADTRICFDLSNYNKVDLQYAIDQGTVNTTTLKWQWSNEGTATTNNFEDQVTLATANVADAHSGVEVHAVGIWNCVFADLSNTNALGLKIEGVAKK